MTKLPLSELADIVRISLGTDRPRQMFPRALDLIRSQVNARSAALFLLDLKTGTFELGCEPIGLDLSPYLPVWVGNQLTKIVEDSARLETNSPDSPVVLMCLKKEVVSNRDGNPEGLDWGGLGVSSGEAAYLAPITRADTCIGAVLVTCREPLHPRQRELLATSAGAVLSIYDLRTQYRLLGEMRTPLDLRQSTGEFFDSVVSLLVRSSGMEFIALRRLEPDGVLTTLRAEKIDEKASYIWPGTTLSRLFEHAILGEESVSVDSVAIEGLQVELSKFAPEVRSFVIAPIIVGSSREAPSVGSDAGVSGGRGRVFGALSLASRVEYQFSPLERLGFTSLANGIGLAIENYWNVSAMSLLREKQVEAGAALQAQEMAQGFRHEIRKKVDNINGMFATEAALPEVSAFVQRQTSEIVRVLDEWKGYASGVEYRWTWERLRNLWDEATDHAEFQLSQAAISVRPSELPVDLEVYCSRQHFVRFVLDGLILNSVDAFRERRSRKQRDLGLSYQGLRGTNHVLRYFDTAGGIRSDRVRGLQRRRPDWIELPLSQVIFEPGFTTKAPEGSGVGGGYGLHLARLTLSQHEGQITLVDAGEPGATFEIYLPNHRVRAAR